MLAGPVERRAEHGLGQGELRALTGQEFAP